MSRGGMFNLLIFSRPRTPVALLKLTLQSCARDSGVSEKREHDAREVSARKPQKAFNWETTAAEPEAVSTVAEPETANTAGAACLPWRRATRTARRGPRKEGQETECGCCPLGYRFVGCRGGFPLAYRSTLARRLVSKDASTARRPVSQARRHVRGEGRGWGARGRQLLRSGLSGAGGAADPRHKTAPADAVRTCASQGRGSARQDQGRSLRPGGQQTRAKDGTEPRAPEPRCRITGGVWPRDCLLEQFDSSQPSRRTPGGARSVKRRTPDFRS